jgi:hypothetical protein
MPRAREYRQQTNAPRGAQLRELRATAQPLVNLEAGANQLARNVDVARREREDRLKESELRRALTDGIDAEAKWQQYETDTVAQAPADGAGLMEKFDEDFAGFRAKAIQGYATQEGRERAEVVLQRLHLDTRRRIGAAQADLLAKDSGRRVSESVSNAGRLVNIDPSRYVELEGMTQGVIAELPGLSAEQRARLAVETRQSMATAAGRGAAISQPYSTLKELSKEKPDAPWARHLDLDSVLQLRSVAQSEVNRREHEARSRQIELQSTLRADLADAFAFRSQGSAARLPDRSRFVAAFGKEGGARYAEAVERWGIYDAVGEAAFMPPAEAQAVLARLKPTSQDGAAERAQNFEAAQRIYAQQRQQLEADPVGVLVNRDPMIRAARDTVIGDGSQPPSAESVSVYFNTLRSRQAALGIAEPKLLPESQRASIAAGLVFNPENPRARVQAIAGLRQAYGREFPAVMREVAPKLDGIARVMIGMKPADAERLDGAFAQKEAFKTTLPPKATNEIKKALAGELAAFSATLADNPDAEERIAEHVEAATLFAQSMVLRGTSPQAAAKAAADAVVLSRFEIVNDLRIPKGVDGSTVLSSLGGIKANLAAGGQFFIPPDPSVKIDDATAQARMRNLIAREGYWITNEDGSGVALRIPLGGGRGEVYNADGTPVEFKFWDLQSGFVSRPLKSLNDPAFAKVK